MLDLIETIMVYKLPQLDRGEIQKMLNINDVELKQTRFYQDVLEEGERKGELKGELKGEARLIVRLLTHRFGPLNSDVVERIRGLSILKLEALGEALLDFSGLDDLHRWLKRHAE